MARPKKHDGVLYRRGRFWWMRYRDRDGTRRLESTETTDWQEAQTRLRERLQARDENVLAVVRRGQQTHVSRVGGLFPGTLFPAALPE